MITFYYGTMGSNKSAEIIRFEDNFSRAGKRAIVVSPREANRENGLVTSRLGLSTKCYEISELFDQEYDAILCDEAQFIELDEMIAIQKIAKERNVDVMFFGLLTTFTGQMFWGTKLIIERCDKIIECTTLCEICGKKKARKNGRFIDNKFTTDGELIQIDNQEHVKYSAMCNDCFTAFFEFTINEGENTNDK